MVDTVQAHDLSLQSDAEAVCDRFKKALKLFSKCHQLYYGTVNFSGEQISELGTCIHVQYNYSDCYSLPFVEEAIDSFVAYYRTAFPKATFLPT